MDLQKGGEIKHIKTKEISPSIQRMYSLMGGGDSSPYKTTVVHIMLCRESFDLHMVWTVSSLQYCTFKLPKLLKTLLLFQRAYKIERQYNETVAEGVRSMKLRYFTPREISNIMCFPSWFGESS